MNRTARSGFTLIELLVVIVIIAILLGLLLPGVQSARESGRRATCQSNLARLGIALQDHETAHSGLPPGTTDAKGPIHNRPQGNHMSWAAHLLPYLDEGATFKHIDLAAGAYAKKNAPARGIHIATLVCPSDQGRWPRDVAVSNYAGCHHDVEAPIDANNHGVLFLNSHIAARDVTDGVAHTIYLGEKPCDPSDLGWISGTRATLRNTGTPINATPLVLAPAGSAKESSAAAGDLLVGGFASSHPAGANFLFGDGTVRFVDQGIDMEIYQQLGDRADGKLLRGGPTRQ